MLFLIDLLHVTYNRIYDGNVIYFLKWGTAVFLGKEKNVQVIKGIDIFFYEVCVYAYFIAAVF